MRRLATWIGFLSFALLSTAPELAAEPVQVPRSVPYAEDARVAENIKRECTTLGTKLATFLANSAAAKGLEVAAADAVDPQAPGRVFVVEITDVASGGNAFIGHRKSMSARGELFVDGVSQGDVDFTRNSGGGFGGGFKGSCAVLGRCTKALGQDLAGWLAEQ